MAAKKELSLSPVGAVEAEEVSKVEIPTERQAQPPVYMDEFDPNIRPGIAKYWDEKEPELIHTWERAETCEDKSLLRRMGKEVCTDEEGSPVRDAMGDILVKHDRKRFENRLKGQQRQSLIDALGTVEEMDSEANVNVDLVQFRQPKEPPKSPIEKINLSLNPD